MQDAARPVEADLTGRAGPTATRPALSLVVVVLLVVASLLAACDGDGSAAAESTPRPSSSPSPPDGRRVSFSGDSVMYQVADAGFFALDRTGTATSRYHLFATVEDGQGRFWANEHESFAPDVIVMLVGTWEDFRMLDGGVGNPPYSAAWDARYGRVVRRHLQWMTRGGAQVIWIGMPVSPPQFNLDFERLNAVYRREVERAGETYLDGTSILADAPRGDTGFTQNASGRLVPLRGVDGHHLCPPALRLMMDAVLDAMVANGEIDRRPVWADQYRWRPERFPFDTQATLRCNRSYTQADADLAATGIFRPQADP